MDIKQLFYTAIVLAGLIFSVIFLSSSDSHSSAKSGEGTSSEKFAGFNSSVEGQRRAPKEVREIEDAKVYMKIYSVDISGDLFFADEKVPIEDFDVRERLDRELHVNTYWHSNTILMMKLANKYFPMIERILAEEGVPDDFKYLVLAESGLRNVTSPAGATGFWQFLKATGKEYGLEISDEVDERYHVEKSTRAACKYINKSYDRFGSWSLASASYNRGSSGISRSLAQQKVDSYFDLYLNTETSRYVFRILALKEIFRNPERYGFYVDKKHLYEEVNTTNVEISEPIGDLAIFAQKYCTNYKTLKLLNPWMRRNYLRNPSRKTYEIKIPI